MTTGIYTITTALHSWQIYDKELADKLVANVDWINIMTYDMGGGIWGNIPKHNTPLDKIKKELAALGSIRPQINFASVWPITVYL